MLKTGHFHFALIGENLNNQDAMTKQYPMLKSCIQILLYETEKNKYQRTEK
jgi:hypothetical protein